MINLKCFSTNQLIALSVLIGVTIAKNLETNDQVTVANMIYIIGDVVTFINGEIENQNSSEQSNKDEKSNGGDSKEVKKLKKQVEELTYWVMELRNKAEGKSQTNS